MVNQTALIEVSDEFLHREFLAQRIDPVHAVVRVPKDHYQARKILVGSFLLQGLAILLLLRGEGAALFWAFVILFAVGHGGALAIAPLVLADLFGSAYLGSLVGAYWLIATAGSLVGPPLAAVLRADTGTYFSVLVVFAASMLAAALLAGMIREQRSFVARPLVVPLHGATGRP
jgi:MFS-type transporter involved in bile tolerance (Atg22 family)